MFPSDERLQAVCGDYYKSYKGYKGYGVYLSVDDAFLVVNVNVFDKLVYESIFVEQVESKSSTLTYEEAKALYGDRIIQEYLANLDIQNLEQVVQDVAHREAKVMQTKMECLQKANAKRSQYANEKRKNILEMLLMGYKPAEIIKELRYSSSVVYKALSLFEEDFVKECFYNDFILSNSVKEVDVKKFIELGFDYKKYLSYKKDRNDKVTKQVSTIQSDAENEPIINQNVEYSDSIDIDTVIKLFEEEPKVTPNVVNAIKPSPDDEIPSYLIKKIDPDWYKFKRSNPYVVNEEGYTVLANPKKIYF